MRWTWTGALISLGVAVPLWVWLEPKLWRRYKGTHRAGLGTRVIRRTPPRALDVIEELDALGYPLCAVDRNGQRYTTAVAGQQGDWWYGQAIILTPGTIARLKRDGLLPLREVDPRTDEVIL